MDNMRGLILLTLLLSPSWLLAADVKTAGFVQGLWYDKSEIFAGEPVRLYVAIRNNTGSDLSGRVDFKDNGKNIGSSNVSALNNRLIESWVDWTPTYGDHTISVTLSRVELSAIGTTTKRVEVVESNTEGSFFVDYDTDKDGIGNQKDNDDDGDGILDTEDSEPLRYNQVEVEAEPDTNDDDGSNPDSDHTAAEETVNNKQDPDRPSGLERFLTKNPADSALSSVTDIVNHTKTKLDDYRQERNETINKRETGSAATYFKDSSGTSTASQSNFGEITRTQTDTDGGVVGKFISFVKDFLSKVYTFILFIFSVYLGHPAIVQMTLLFLIIFIIFKLARRLASRPY